MPLVSVIIPTRDRPALLAEALASVLGQSLGDFEVIVVDDGSAIPAQDGVGALSDDPRLRFIRQPHAGRSAARNRALAAATGELLALLDDDDLFLGRKLESHVAYMASHLEVDATVSGVQVIDQQGRPLQKLAPWRAHPRLNLRSFLYMLGYAPSAVVLRRAALERLDYWFDPALSYAEDTDFFLRLFTSGARFDWIRQPLVAYRLAAGQSALKQFAPLANCLKLIQQLLAGTDLPADVVGERDRILANAYTVSALHALLLGLEDLGRDQMAHAFELAPAKSPADLARLRRILVGIARGLPKAARRAYLSVVGRNLPPGLVPCVPAAGTVK